MDHIETFEKWYNYTQLDAGIKSELEEIKNDAKKIKEYFFASLEFGTAGLRGIMRAGINSMNIYTVRHATQGIANLIKQQGREGDGVVIVRDSRNNSDLFSREVAGVLAANGIKVYIFDDIRPTAELSFAIRHLGCVAGINITASHNPKEYNGYKAYWEDGAQLPPDYAAIVFEAINETDIFEDVLTCDFETAAAEGKIITVGEEIDEIYLQNIAAQSVYPDIIAQADENFKVIYTPLHGAGYKLVPEILRRKGLKNLLLVEEQMRIDGNFPTVKTPNPEYKEVFTMGVKIAKKENCSLLVGTDPDSDRVGIMVRTDSGDYITVTGNQVGALLLDYMITAKREQGTLAANACAVKTIVTTELAAKICEQNGVAIKNVLTGFKFIGELIKQFEETGEYTYLLGFEESYGYLAGTYARDKDAVVATMLIVEMAAYYAKKGMTLFDALQKLYERYGYYEESVQNLEFIGIDGVEKMKGIMASIRNSPPAKLGGYNVESLSDYKTGVTTYYPDNSTTPTTLPASDVLYFTLTGSSKVIIRPSGTEPKIKIYYLVTAKDKPSAQRQTENLKNEMKSLIS